MANTQMPTDTAADDPRRPCIPVRETLLAPTAVDVPRRPCIPVAENSLHAAAAAAAAEASRMAKAPQKRGTQTATGAKAPGNRARLHPCPLLRGGAMISTAQRPVSVRTYKPSTKGLALPTIREGFALGSRKPEVWPKRLERPGRDPYVFANITAEDVEKAEAAVYRPGPRKGVWVTRQPLWRR
jgi:hypothetical protein